MGYFDQDAQAMLETYVLETRQLLEKLDEILLRTEKKGELDTEEINEIFRIMHTTKSSSAIMGLADLSSLAHLLEDLFMVFRDEPKSAEKITQDLFELLFAVSDFIKEELDNMKHETYQPAQIDRLQKALKNYLLQLKESDEEGSAKAAEVNNAANPFLKKNGVILRVYFENDCKMEHVRSFMLVNRLKSVCSDVACYPAEPEKHPEAAQEIKEQGLLICIKKEKLQEALAFLKTGLFVRRCEIAAENEETSEPVAKTAQQPVAVEKNQESALESQYVNVRTERLDTIQNLTGELMLLMASFKNQPDEHSLWESKEHFEHMTDRIMDELEDEIIGMRMIPVGTMIPPLRRILRDVCKKQKKEVDFTVSGQEVEADKNIVEGLYKAAIHVLRNAADHGIELPDQREQKGKPRVGKVSFEVRSSGGELAVTISDDGRGMDQEKLCREAEKRGMLTKSSGDYTPEEIYELSTLPGLSTKDKVNEYSGRGVGMDAVRDIVQTMGGHFRIKSEVQKGTSIIIHLPLTRTIVDSVSFSVAGQLFSIPAHQVFRFFEYASEDGSIQYQDGSKAVSYEGRLLPIIDLCRYYGMHSEMPQDDKMIICVKGPESEACIIADQVLGKAKLVLKPLPPLLRGDFQQQTGMNGCSIVGVGSLCMSLDIETLAQHNKNEITIGKE